MEQEEVAFNAKVVAEMEQRFGKFDEESFQKFLNELDTKEALQHADIF